MSSLQFRLAYSSCLLLGMVLCVVLGVFSFFCGMSSGSLVLWRASFLFKFSMPRLLITYKRATPSLAPWGWGYVCTHCVACVYMHTRACHVRRVAWCVLRASCVVRRAAASCGCVTRYYCVPHFVKSAAFCGRCLKVLHGFLCQPLVISAT